jgi:hypothetical protein
VAQRGPAATDTGRAVAVDQENHFQSLEGDFSPIGPTLARFAAMKKITFKVSKRDLHNEL